jgi:hypothetical protein
MSNYTLDLSMKTAVGCAPCIQLFRTPMSKKTFMERRVEAMAGLEQAKQRLASLDDTAAARIGRLALRAGLVEIDLSDADLLREFSSIRERFRATPADRTAPHSPAVGEN